MISTLKSFIESTKNEKPPEDAGKLLQALWWEKKGDWDRAHHIAQDINTPDAAWVHAYLHRREGDKGNANYWYSRAGRPKSEQSLDDEWNDIVNTILS